MGEITPPPADRIDTSKPHPARVYDWFLGGKDNYPVDEELGRQIVALEPQSKYAAQHNRWFMQRATRHLAGAAGARQFLDIGSGIPTEPNLHRIAQGAAPDARVVYVDNDPIVLAHAGHSCTAPRRAAPNTSRRTCGNRRRSSNSPRTSWSSTVR